jgi:hypothetical protein
LRDEKPMQVFSAAGSSRDSAGSAAKCDDFGAGESYFSDINDLLAEGEGFGTLGTVFTAKPRHIRKRFAFGFPSYARGEEQAIPGLKFGHFQMVRGTACSL